MEGAQNPRYQSLSRRERPGESAAEAAAGPHPRAGRSAPRVDCQTAAALCRAALSSRQTRGCIGRKLRLSGAAAPARDDPEPAQTRAASGSWSGWPTRVTPRGCRRCYAAGIGSGRGRFLANGSRAASATPPPSGAFTLQRMRRRWGSCSRDGRIVLNTLGAPENCIDYVIVHELCHTVQHNRSRAFYDLLRRACPTGGSGNSGLAATRAFWNLGRDGARERGTLLRLRR